MNKSGQADFQGHGTLVQRALAGRGLPAWIRCRQWVVRVALVVAPATVAAAPAPPGPQAKVHAAIWPAAGWPLGAAPAVDARVRAILAHMTLEEKVGQLVQADIRSATPDDVRKYHLGSVLASGNSGPDGRQFGNARAWLATAGAYYRASIDTGAGTRIPVLFGIDAVHGADRIVGATLFPHNVGLGATRDPRLIRAIGAATAEEMRAAGIAWTFAPVVAVPQDLRWGRTYEGFGERPFWVTEDARAEIEGLQGLPGTPGFLDATHVAATAKHFIGDGLTRGGVDRGNADISEARLRDLAAAPFVAAIDAGVQGVMVSLSSWQHVPVIASRGLLVDVLKQRMRFGGIVLSDYDAQVDLPGCAKAGCTRAIDHGTDMLMVPNGWRLEYAAILRAARDGRLPIARLDDAVARILRVKVRLGMFARVPSRQALAGRFDLIGSAAHRALARRAVRESLVLLKNAQHLLPLDPRQRVLIAGTGADNIPMQSGGWTLNWQGDHLKAADFPGATSIGAGLRAQIDAAGGHAELSPDGDFQRKPDVAIVVFGESPYAEYVGDRKSLSYGDGKSRDVHLIEQLHARGIPVVAVFLSGRPLYVTPAMDSADAFVAAWLPGSEGEGVADVLLRTPDGRIAHDFRGRLPYAWPRTPAQGPRSTREKGAELFPYGFGLTYASKQVARPNMTRRSQSMLNGQVGRTVATW